jgi:hypothetical protein
LDQSRPSVPAIATEVSLMSHTGAAKFTAVVKNPVAPRRGTDDQAVESGSPSGDDLATSPRPPRAATRARMGRSRRFDPHSYDDPSNYLG